MPVPETGVVVFPLIGARKVTDTDISVLRDSLIKAFTPYLQTPSIEIRFLRRISIVGSVRNPGVFHIDDTHSVSDALALAGGATPDGKADQVQLFRGSEKLVGSITRRTRIADLPLESGDQLYVPQRAWLDRNTGIVATLISGVVSVGIALLAR
jgi:protein involved in polysaccharide export with SLBB domain